MGKNDIAGFSLWESYSSEVRKRMNNPSHLGSFTDEDATKRGLKLVSVMHGAETCGDAVELFLLVNDNGVVRDARFLSFGCGTAIASSDMMCELCLGKTIDEISKITNIDVEKALRDSPDKPAVPGQKMHCSVMAYDVLKKAVADYKGVDYQELIDNEIVCECAQVTKQTVVDAIRNNDLKTVEEITSYTKAGGYCKSCIRPGGHEKRSVYLIDILNQT
ncbi:MAG: iron-sulfur cluster assembly scaffold protein, partial [Fibrobacterota bacterium]